MRHLGLERAGRARRFRRLGLGRSERFWFASLLAIAGHLRRLGVLGRPDRLWNMRRTSRLGLQVRHMGCLGLAGRMRRLGLGLVGCLRVLTHFGHFRSFVLAERVRCLGLRSRLGRMRRVRLRGRFRRVGRLRLFGPFWLAGHVRRLEVAGHPCHCGRARHLRLRVRFERLRCPGFFGRLRRLGLGGLGLAGHARRLEVPRRPCRFGRARHLRLRVRFERLRCPGFFGRVGRFGHVRHLRRFGRFWLVRPIQLAWCVRRLGLRVRLGHVSRLGLRGRFRSVRPARPFRRLGLPGLVGLGWLLEVVRLRAFGLVSVVRRSAG